MAMKKRSKRFLWIGVAAVVAAILVIIGISRKGDDATMVQADVVETGDIFEKVTASGRIQPQTQVNISSEVSAQIIELYVAEGDIVSTGDQLALLDTIQLQSDVQQARFGLDETAAHLEAAKAQYEQNKREFERKTSLYGKQLVSETEYTDARFAHDNSKANYDAAVAQMNTGRARLGKMVDNLKKTGIKAPMDGVITYLSAEVGEIAQAQTSYTQGKTLMTIADLSVFEVEVDVDETEIAKIKLGQNTDIRVDAFPDTIFAGTVVEIGNSAQIEGQGTENYSTNFRVKVRFNDAFASIRPGMSATVDITTASSLNALLIPYASVVTREFDPDSLETKKSQSAQNDNNSLLTTANADDNIEESNSPEPQKTSRKKKEKIKKNGVYVIHGDTAHFVEVTTGIADERNIAALTGLSPNDTIVSGSYQTLRKLENGEVVKIDETSIKRINGEEE